MKNLDSKNKYNISLKTLKDLRVAKKDYNKVYEIDFVNSYVSKINNVTTIIPVVKYVYSPIYVDKQYCKPTSLTRNRFFSSDGFPQRTRISSIYNQY